MQYGGGKGLSVESLHLQVRMWQSTSEGAAASLGLLFIDIQAAFYSVAKPILTGFTGEVADLRAVFAKMGLPDSAFDAFLKNVMAGSVVYHATGSKVCQAHARASLNKSWFAIPGGSSLQAPDTGSRPGDPVADVLFGMLMSRVLEQLQDQLRFDEMAALLRLQDHTMPHIVTWVDDIAMAIYAPAHMLVSKVAAAASTVLDVMAEHGLKLAYGSGKTATILQFRGKGAVKARQACEAAFADGIPLVSEHFAPQRLPIVSHYKHLGGYIVRQGTIHQDIQVKVAKAVSNLRPVRAFLRDSAIPVAHRRMIVKAMGMSILQLHAGTWPKLNQQDFQAWKGAVWQLYRSLNSFAVADPDHQHWYQGAREMDAPLPMEALFLARLRLLVQLLGARDEMLYDAILANWHTARSLSWLAALKTSLHWLQEQLGGEVLPSVFDELHTLAGWQEAGAYVFRLKKCLRQAQRAHLLRIADLCELQTQQQRQRDLLVSIGWTPPSVEGPATPVADTAVCPLCAKEFSTPASLAVHAMKVHGERIAMRRFALDATCRVCQRHYTTRARLLRHLHMGTTQCWVQHCRWFLPADPDVAAAHDARDRDRKQALHHQGLLAHEADRLWRPAQAHELVPVLEQRPGPHPRGDPTPDELAQWHQFGA